MSDSEEEYEYDYGSDADSMPDDDVSGSDKSGDEGSAENEKKSVKKIKIEIENSFYEGEDIEEENPTEAIRLFEQVVKLENEIEAEGGGTAEWRFKALQHIVELSYRLKKYTEMLIQYKIMLNNMQNVTRNDCTDALNSVLETISNSKDDNMLAEMFNVTLEALKTANNERLWFTTTLKLAKLYLHDIDNKCSQIEDLMSTLKQTCQLPDGSDNPAKASNLLEIYSLEIQFCRLTRNGTRMRTIYPKTLNLDAAVADPRIMGVIREEGGKMHMSEYHWDDAFYELNEAFRNFQAAGNNSRAKTCLKYVALSSMLSKTAVNPFDGREAKVFERDPEIQAMNELRTHLQNNDLMKFERVLSDKRNGIMTEEVLMTYIDMLRKRMREHVLLNLVNPYKKVTLNFLAKKLNLTEILVESMLVRLIQQGDLNATINQIHGYVVLGDSRKSATSSSGKESIQEKKAKALGVWADALVQINQNLAVQLS
jgi:COP9 signalosome complex subunit 2